MTSMCGITGANRSVGEARPKEDISPTELKEGKGNRPNGSESEDSEHLWESGALGEGDPETLQDSYRALADPKLSIAND